MRIKKPAGAGYVFKKRGLGMKKNLRMEKFWEWLAKTRFAYYLVRANNFITYPIQKMEYIQQRNTSVRLFGEDARDHYTRF